MMYVYLVLAMAFSAAITVSGRLYNAKNAGVANVSRLYNVIVPISATLGWLVFWVSDLSFDPGVLPYSFLYGIGYSCFTYGILNALKNGSTSLTALAKQLSLVGVSIWGFLFWDTQFTALTVTGLVLIVAALVLCLVNKEQGGNGGNLIKWLFFAALTAASNAGCSIIQKYQQMAFEYQHKNMFMFFGVLFASVFCLLLSRKEEKQNWPAALKRSWMFPALAGVSSAFSNSCILLLIRDEMSPAIIYPGVAVGGLMITIFISLLCFRERIRPLQWCGLAIGAVALVLLSI